MSKQTPAAPVKSNSVDDFSSPMLTSLEMLRSASRESNDAADPPPTHGLLVPSKKRTNSSYAYTMLLCGFTYHVCYRRDTPRGERVYWRCQLRGQCKARLITDIHGRIVVFTNPEHSHPSTANGLEMSAARRRQHAALQKTNSEREDETKEKKPKEGELKEDKQQDQQKLDQTVREIYEKIAAESRSAEAKRPRGVLDCLERSTTFDDSFLGVETPSMGSSVVSSTSVVFPDGNLSTIDRLLIQQNSEGYGSFADEEEDERHEADETNGRELPELLEEDEPQVAEPKEEEAAEEAVEPEAEEAISDEESVEIESEEEDEEDAHSPPTSANGSEINLEDVWNQISLLQTFNFAAATNHRNERKGATSSKPKKKAAVDLKAEEIVAERLHKIPLERAEAIGEAVAHSGVPSTNQTPTSPALQLQNNGLQADDRRSKGPVDSAALMESLRASGWSLSLAPTNNTRQQLWKSFRFADFNAAFGFMSRVALRAAALRAFPEWTNSAGVVHVRLPRDGRREIRAADLQLAAFMDRICGEQT
ncbi:putative pterin-4-alpha-carbinolamine dehydratase [Aphelenchoides fujianensis]|nr:putative pterin-4-alpha-carbinolamine dehydratase [Aphelenchoides fujianensis]